MPRPSTPSVRTLASLVASLLALSVLAGCGGDDSEDPAPRSTGPETQGRIVQSGFGQREQFVWVTALVENDSDHGGQTATVAFKVLDADGAVIGRATEHWTFSWTSQVVAIGTQVQLKVGQEAASVEPTLTIKDDDPRPSTPQVPTVQVRPKQQTGGAYTARVRVTNPTELVLQRAMVGMACFTGTGEISGGGVAYSASIDPGKSVEVEPGLLIGPDTETCTAYVAP